jgi:hypothetical protein
MNTQFLDITIPAQPDIGVIADVAKDMRTCSYRGKPLAAVTYNELTQSGGVLDMIHLAWVCWSPITAEAFAAAVENTVQELREREDGKLAALNS